MRIHCYQAVLALLMLTTACTKEDVTHQHLDGEVVALYNGKARVAAELSSGQPQTIVLTIDAAAMNSLPIGNLPHQMFMLHLPAQLTASTNIDFIGLDWNPAGHEPTGIYTLPHFDVHYYFMNHSQVMGLNDMGKMNIDPPAAYLPANFIPGPSIPQMGKHWLDATSPELNGGPFTQTFIWGSYDGKISFYEPMIARSYLLSINRFERSIPQPAKVQKDAFYPAKLLLEQQGGEVKITLKDFNWRTAS